jgi:hypothetical protein
VRDTVDRIVIQSGQVQIIRKRAAKSGAEPPDEDSGWLGRQDSNLGMADSKSASKRA